MIESNVYMHFENKKLKKIDKLNICFNKMILIEYKNYSIYHLYNKESNLIFVSYSIDVNKNSMLKKLTITKIYKIKFSTIKFVKFDEFFTFESHKINFFLQIDKLINKSIFEHMILLIRNK